MSEIIVNPFSPELTVILRAFLTAAEACNRADSDESPLDGALASQQGAYGHAYEGVRAVFRRYKLPIELLDADIFGAYGNDWFEDVCGALKERGRDLRQALERRETQMAELEAAKLTYASQDEFERDRTYAEMHLSKAQQNVEEFEESMMNIA